MFPPVPESPNRQLPSKSSGTPRVGMHLYQNDDDDDDVSVLTFHTLGAKDVVNHHHNVGGNNINNNSSYIKSARESLERLVLESKEASGDDSLARISEEDGSHQSSCHSKSKSSSTTKCEEREKTVQEETEEDDEDGNYGENDDDDDTISLAESILTSASKVLSNIGSSPYYAGRNKREVSSSTATKLRESPLPKPNPKHPSPMKQPIKSMKDTEKDEDKKYMKYAHESNNQTYSSTKKKVINNDDTNCTRLEVSSTFLRSYFHDDDENTKPYVNRYSNGTAINKHMTKGGSSKGTNGDEHIQQLESETKKLHALLKERQSETKKSTQTLGTSIKKANELLERISSAKGGYQ